MINSLVFSGCHCMEILQRKIILWIIAGFVRKLGIFLGNSRSEKTLGKIQEIKKSLDFRTDPTKARSTRRIWDTFLHLPTAILSPLVCRKTMKFSWKKVYFMVYLIFPSNYVYFHIFQVKYDSTLKTAKKIHLCFEWQSRLIQFNKFC
jgi:hypothetical protein